MARRRRKKKRKHNWGTARKKRAAHREPPLPSCFSPAEGGRCRWCCEPILKPDGTVNKRRLWHPQGTHDCLHQYFIVSRPSYAKRQVKKRDKGVCVDCKKQFVYRNEWQVDHVIPLADVPERHIRFWQLGNLETRCNGCHSKKTVIENAKRREAKKAS
jgi:5-methylcytosine-specific restriction endonuclease McrA